MQAFRFSRSIKPRLRRILAGAAVMLWVAVKCGTPASGEFPDRLAIALAAYPGVSPRLSVGVRHRPCTEHVPAGGTVPRADCPAPRARRRPTAADAGIVPGSDDPHSIHGLALLDLVADDPRGIALDRAITSLRRVIELSDDPTPALVDLSAALIVRAERQQTPRDLLEAYETAYKATERQPHNPAALYNRALALERFGLVEETAEDWKLAIAADPASAWAGEARRRLHALQSIHAPIPPRDDAPLADYARYAAEDAQGARELGMDKLLPAWGEAVLRGDTARAADRLSRAEALGTALLRRPGGDASLADMVHAIHDVAVDNVVTRELAGAHREYGNGRRAYVALAYATAHEALQRSDTLADASSALRAWAQFYLGTTVLQNGDSRQGEQQVRRTAEHDARRYPSLVGCADWALGRTLAQHDDWERALQELSRATALLHAAGEQQNEGSALAVVSDGRALLGEPDSAYVAVHRSLALLRSQRSSLRLHNLLVAIAGIAAADGMRRFAFRSVSEDVQVADRTANPMFAAEARLERARHWAGAGDRVQAQADLGSALGLVDRIPDGRAREWLRADLQDAQGVALVSTDPANAARNLDASAAFFESVPLPFRVLPNLVGAAEAFLNTGRPSDALKRLEAAVRILDERRDSIRMEPRRAAVFNTARHVVSRIAVLELAANRPEEALRHLDDARAALAPAGRRTNVREHESIRSAPGEIGLGYDRIADTLLIWVVTSRQVHATRVVIDTIRFTRTISELNGKLQRGAPEAETLPQLSRAYDWLIRPIEDRLRASDAQIMIVASGEIAGVPFPALYDRRHQQYLIEQHPLRFATSFRRTRQGTHSRGGVLLVADPAFDQRTHPLLARLDHSRDEIRQIADDYPGARSLEGTAATREALESNLARVEVAHFAGHAVFDDARPERSYLVLAPSPHRHDDGRLTAAELAQMNVSGLRLVVLSSCRTASTSRVAGDGFTGLSGALLAAGAGGVIGSTWEVDDSSTSKLMTEFHREYHADRRAPDALRRAQLALLGSPNAALRNPAAWAGFRYTGG